MTPPTPGLNDLFLSRTSEVSRKSESLSATNNSKGTMRVLLNLGSVGVGRVSISFICWRTFNSSFSKSMSLLRPLNQQFSSLVKWREVSVGPCKWFSSLLAIFHVFVLSCSNCAADATHSESCDWTSKIKYGTSKTMLA